MAASRWLVEDGSFDPVALARRRLPQRPMRALRVGTGLETEGADAAPAPTPAPKLALYVKPLVIRNTQKMFGAADIRVDTMVVHAGPPDSDLYHPSTFRFPRISDGDDLADGDGRGLLVYYGRPQELVAFTITVSRDIKDSQDLATLLRAGASTTLPSIVGDLGIGAMPQVAAFQGAVAAAATLTNLAYDVVRAVTPTCLGLMRGNWTSTENWGAGRHPASGLQRKNDIDFAYEIVTTPA
ncbi:MAG: hypothetical protein ABR586_03115 [Thermoplasmatota archaeon]